MSPLSSTWQCPSNIAIVKYWGKKGFQLPANPSVSFTLQECTTTTTLQAFQHPGRRNPEVQLYFDGEYNEPFTHRARNYFHELAATLKWLKSYDFEITTTNNFPHGAGIASSASAYGALGLCLASIEQALGLTDSENFLQRASFLARLGSGSASRSVYGGWVIWGKTLFQDKSSDKYALPLDTQQIHPLFLTLQDSIIIVSDQSKSVSSTVGHGMMQNHPYAKLRYARANEHTQKLISILQQGDWESFAHICQTEALDLHAMMMTSENPFLLLKPQTLQWIEWIKEWKIQENLKITYTLDAGPNLHILYPDTESIKVRKHIENALERSETLKVIHDRIGQGPMPLTSQTLKNG